MQVIIAAPQTGDTSRLQVTVHIQAEVLSAEAARRRANCWLLENIGNLLRAEMPELMAGDQLTWRVNVALTSPVQGRLGKVGHLFLDAATGQVLIDETSIQEILAHAAALAPA